jgi:molybdopterin synthase sulfur carrier subunit
VGDSVIEVVYLARLREAFGRAGERVTLATHDDATVADVVGQLRARGGVWAAELAAGRAFRIAVNHTMASADTSVRAGDELALFPPVTGG